MILRNFYILVEFNFQCKDLHIFAGLFFVVPKNNLLFRGFHHFSKKSQKSAKKLILFYQDYLFSISVLLTYKSVCCT